MGFVFKRFPEPAEHPGAATVLVLGTRGQMHDLRLPGVFRLDTEEGRTRGDGAEEVQKAQPAPERKECSLCSSDHRSPLCLAPQRRPLGLSPENSSLLFWVFLLRHVASDHDISVRCCQRLGLRRMSLYPGRLAKKKCGARSLLASVLAGPPLSFPRQWGRAM